MALLSELFNIVNSPEGQQQAMQDKVQGYQQQLQEMRQRMMEQTKPSMQQVIDNQLNAVTGASEAKQRQIEKTADQHIDNLLGQGEKQASLMQMQNAFQSAQRRPMPPVNPRNLLASRRMAQPTMQDTDGKLTKSARTTIQKSLLETDGVMRDAMVLYDQFDPKYFTYGEKAKHSGQQVLEKIFGEGEYLEDPKENQKRSAYFQKAKTAFFNWVKQQSGAQVSDKEMERRLKARFNEDMSPSEARGAITNMMEEIVVQKMALKSLLKDGFAMNEERDFQKHRKLLDAQKKMHSGELKDYVDKFMKNEHNKKMGATRMDAMMMYMYKNGLMGSGK